MEIEINPRWINGNWKAGWKLDLHTISSQHNPDGTFETQRTQLGELLWRFLVWRGTHLKLKCLSIKTIVADC